MSAHLKPYTAEETLILLSFPMVNHGGLFAHWLRDRLMKHYHLYSVNAVYCDCVASRHLPSVHVARPSGLDADTPTPRSAEQQSAYDAGQSIVTLDTRSRFANQGYRPIGAANKAWDENFRKAMAQAQAMVFVCTGDYVASQWCMQEWGQFHDENRARAGRRPLLKGVVLDFVGGEGLRGQDQTNMTVLAMTKVTGLGGLLWQTRSGNGLEAAWGIGEGDFARLVAAIGQVT